MPGAPSADRVGVRRGVVVAWVMCGMVVAIVGGAYATGFATSSGSSADTARGAASPLLGQPAQPEQPLYPGAVTAFGLPIAFDGLFGQITHDTDVFTVTVPADDPRTGSPYPGGTTFAINVYVTNQPELVSGGGGHTGWTTLQLQWTVAECAGGTFYDETAATPTFAAAVAQQVMDATGGTIHVALAGLSPGTTYCAGVAQAYPDANNPTGTDIARPYATDADAQAANPSWTSAIPVSPQLTAQLQQT